MSWTSDSLGSYIVLGHTAPLIPGHLHEARPEGIQSGSSTLGGYHSNAVHGAGRVAGGEDGLAQAGGGHLHSESW